MNRGRGCAGVPELGFQKVIICQLQYFAFITAKKPNIVHIEFLKIFIRIPVHSYNKCKGKIDLAFLTTLLA